MQIFQCNLVTLSPLQKVGLVYFPSTEGLRLNAQFCPSKTPSPRPLTARERNLKKENDFETIILPQTPFIFCIRFKSLKVELKKENRILLLTIAPFLISFGKILANLFLTNLHRVGCKNCGFIA
ncbi:MAG: hypothetical protein ACI9XO_002714 [Paraglaciecola sp.]|jgi:hypothetical protein